MRTNGHHARGSHRDVFGGASMLDNPPTGLIGAAALLATLGGVLLWLIMLSGPLRLGTGLLDARTHLTKAQRSLAQGGFRPAVFEAYAAQAGAHRARHGLEADSPIMDLATLAPVVADAMGEVPHLVGAMERTSDAAVGTLEIGLGALRGEDNVIARDPQDPKGKIIRLDRLEELGATLDQVRADVRAAGAQLRAVNPKMLPRRLRGDIDDGIRQVEETDALLVKAQAGFRFLPRILGADEPRTYMLGFQNSGELRGSGGAMLQFEFLTIDEGRPRLAGSQGSEDGDGRKSAVGSIYKLDNERQQLSIPLPPDAWYVREIPDAQRFGNFNWSPDWPLDSKLAIAYGNESADVCVPSKGEPCPEFPELDGVIAVDPGAVEKLMPGVGPFTHGPYRISEGRVVDVLLSKAYDYFPVPAFRRDYLGRLVSRFFSRLFAPAQPTELVQGFGQSLAEKHVQLWMKNPDEQAFVEQMGWDGSIKAAREADYFSVVEQNVGGNKLNYTSGQTNTLDVTLEGDTAVHSTTVSVENLIELPQPRWVLGDSKSAHRPMLNFYVPAGAELLSADAGEPCVTTELLCNGRLDTPAPAVWADGFTPPTHTEKGKQVWSATLQIPAGASGSFAVDYRVPSVVRSVNGRRVYRLALQRQPKVNPERVLVRLQVPEGARDVRAPGFEQDAGTLVYDKALKSDMVLEVSWQE
jgi:hypothetical protein